MGPGDAPDGAEHLSRYVLDTTVLIAHLRGDAAVTQFLLSLLAAGHSLGTTCVNADALVAGTARGHGAILITDNTDDFPMRDIRVEAPPLG